MAVVYAVMLEYGFNKTEFGKGVLGSCFINDLGTVIALGLIFAPFNYKTTIFILVSGIAFFIMPSITSFLTRTYGFKTAGTISKDNFFIRRIRTLTIGFLTPFYFLRAGALISLPAVLSAPVTFLVLFVGKVLSKIFGLQPVIKQFRKNNKKETWYYTLLMSTGLTFGTISALYGFTHGIVTKAQYSYLVAVVIASAVIPTMIANTAFLPKHLLKKPVTDEEEIPEFRNKKIKF